MVPGGYAISFQIAGIVFPTMNIHLEVGEKDVNFIAEEKSAAEAASGSYFGII